MKNETKHTPGPWNVVDTGHGYDIIGDTHQQVLVADCYPDSVKDYETPLDSELKANARLIAAAPEMLEALIKVEQLSARLVGGAFTACEGRHSMNGSCLYCDHTAILDASRAAIAKATGSKP